MDVLHRDVEEFDRLSVRDLPSGPEHHRVQGGHLLPPGCRQGFSVTHRGHQPGEELLQGRVGPLYFKVDVHSFRPQAVAWEIRKSMNSPTHKYHEKSAQKMMEALPM